MPALRSPAQVMEVYGPLIRAAAERHGVDPMLVAAVIWQESRGDPRAYRAEPKIGDASYGLMQLLLRTARGLDYQGGPDGLFNPATNIELGTRYLAELLRAAERTGRPDPVTIALSAYNAGPSAVRPGDAKRDATGAPINLRSYVLPVLNAWAKIREAAGTVVAEKKAGS